MRTTRLLIVAAGAAAAVFLFLALRPDGEDDAVEPSAAPATTDTGGTAAPAPEPEPEPKPKPKPTAAVVAITIRGGRPEDGVRRATVRKNRQVRLVVRSDVADHVHLHGYDIMRDVGPGAPAQLAFRATIPGRFEVELEERGVQIAELEVRP